MYRAVVANLYREKQGNGISDERKLEIQECAGMSANEVSELFQDIINTAVADLKISAIRVVPADSDIPTKSMENAGMKPPESSEVLPVVCTQGETCATICDVSGAYLRAERFLKKCDGENHVPCPALLVNGIFLCQII